MTKHIWTGVCVTIVGFATAAMTAQTTSPPQSNAPSASSERRITVTGCLKQAPASASETATTGAATGAAGAAGAAAGVAGATGAAGATGTTGTAGTATTAGDAGANAPKFILTNATSSPAETSAAAGGTETPPAPAAAAASEAQTYRLIANPTALSPHLGKKVELTGTLENQAAATHGADPSAGSEANSPTLRVESGKVVGPSCSQ